jgi:hypothetical protein
MNIGTGIAIAGVWAFAGAALLSPQVTSIGTWISVIVAIGITIYLK